MYFTDLTFAGIEDSDILAGHIWRHDLADGSTSVFRSPSGMANGLIFDLDGNMLMAQGANFGGRSVIRLDMASGKSTIIAGSFNGRSFNAPNDLVLDEAGRIYFTDPRYFGHEPVEQPVKGVYRIDPDGSIALVIEETGMPNGIVISPDQRTLYVASLDASWSGRNALLAYDLAEDGSASNRRVVADFGDDLGPDGMAVDTEGSIYLARPSEEPGIYIYSPEGQLEEIIDMPEGPANVAFGRGEYSQTLFITAWANLYSIAVTRQGFHPTRR